MDVLEMVSVPLPLELANVDILIKNLIVLQLFVILPIVQDTVHVTIQPENVYVIPLMLVHLALFLTQHAQMLAAA